MKVSFNNEEISTDNIENEILMPWDKNAMSVIAQVYKEAREKASKSASNQKDC